MEQVLSNNLKRLRVEKQLTQEQAAEKLGVSAQSISRWECGTTLPDVLLLPQIARLYCVTTDDLFREHTVIYANYAQRLASLYEYTRKPEDFLQAEQEFRRLFETQKYQPEDLRIYGVIHHYMMNDCKNKALESFERLETSKANGDDETLFRARGQKLAFLADIGRNEESISAQLRIVESGSADWREYCLLLSAYCRAGDYETAYVWFQKAVQLFPDAWALYVFGGDISKERKCYDEAFACWDSALALNPKALDAKYARGLAFEELGEYERACQAWCELAEDLKTGGFEIEMRPVLQRAAFCREKYTG